MSVLTTITCRLCQLDKPPEDFQPTRKTCRDCRTRQHREYCQATRSARKASAKKHRERNRVRIQAYFREYRKQRPAYITGLKRNWKRTEKGRAAAKRWRHGNGKLAAYLRARLKMALRRSGITNSRKGSAVRDLGCTVAELRVYLASLFKPGMSWGNYGEWHIDHVKPLASFDLTSREHLLQAVHYSNLQPLWAADNYAKGASV